MTITITREQRDALHREIRTLSLLADGPAGDVEKCLGWPGKGEEARRLWTRMALAASVLDAIGWEIVSDRDSYELALDSPQIEWVRSVLVETEGTLKEHEEAFAEVRAGKDPWENPRFPRAESDPIENDVADLRALSDRDLELVGACRAILDQADEIAVA